MFDVFEMGWERERERVKPSKTKQNRKKCLKWKGKNVEDGLFAVIKHVIISKEISIYTFWRASWQQKQQHR